MKITGTVFLIIGGVGIILPLLPTTPFLLLALTCYAKSSKRLYNWLLYNKWFGEYIKNWHEGRGIPVKTKILTIALLFLTMGYSVAFVVPSFIGKAFFIVYQV
ncbi:MAG: YbaN family protein [Methanosarcinales archaeon]|nr:YbaN family protein [Methanosarcinales archaeon]